MAAIQLCASATDFSGEHRAMCWIIASVRTQQPQWHHNSCITLMKFENYPANLSIQRYLKLPLYLMEAQHSECQNDPGYIKNKKGAHGSCAVFFNEAMRQKCQHKAQKTCHMNSLLQLEREVWHFAANSISAAFALQVWSSLKAGLN